MPQPSSDSRTRLLAFAGVLFSLALVARDNADDPGPVPQASQEAQIAEVVNTMFSAWSAGDGEQACSSMTARGQLRAARVARALMDAGQRVDFASCPAAIAASTAEVNGEMTSQVDRQPSRADTGDR